MIKYLILKLIQFYQKALSPLLPARCRFYPTCSVYARQAISWHGAATGSYLAVRRLCRCHPWGGSGVDFVPLPLYRYHFAPSARRFSYIYKDVCSYAARLNWQMARG